MLQPPYYIQQANKVLIKYHLIKKVAHELLKKTKLTTTIEGLEFYPS